MERNDNAALLDKLVQLSSCRFVSDLPAAKWRTRLLTVISPINAADYTTVAWLYAAQYISRNQIPWNNGEYTTSESAKNALQSWLVENQKV